MSSKDLVAKVKVYLPEDKVPLIEEAIELTSDKSKSGMDQSVGVALILAGLQMDAESLIAALLLDLPEDGTITPRVIETKFGVETKDLLDGVGKVSHFSWHVSIEAEAERLRRMFIAVAEDVRVIIITLANRLQLLRNMKKLPPEDRSHVCEETMEVFAPLAHRLGMGQMQSEMQDIAFRYLQPDDYKEISSLVDVRRAEWDKDITHAIRILKDEFAKAGLEAEITGRPKSVYSIYTKMNKYASDGKDFSDIYDLLAVRILLDGVPDCYNALGIVHSLWHPLSGQFDDYIANPKGDVYQSLHSTVMAFEGKPLEIQIRTHDMHRNSEYGVAAHWRYKEGSKKDQRFEEKLSLFRQLMEWQKDVSGVVLVDSLKTDFFKEQVYVFTPKGEIKELPRGSTPLDFAYRIHTNIGHSCTGAKVNGKLVSLSYQLSDGDVVDIVKAKNDRGPSLDWLNSDLGYLRSNHAREKVKQWFRKQERTVNLDRGRTLFEKEIKRLGISVGIEEVATLFGFGDSEGFLVAIGCGDVSPHQIGPKLIPKEEPEPEILVTAPKKPQTDTGIEVLGIGDLLTNLAPCCSPVPGDEIIGFVTRTKGVTVHRRDCRNVSNEHDKERLIQVNWGAAGVRSYPVSIAINGQDRVGLLKDISTVVSEARVNIISVSNVAHSDSTSSIYLTVDIKDIGHLSKLLSKLESLRGVISATRIRERAREEAG